MVIAAKASDDIIQQYEQDAAGGAMNSNKLHNIFVILAGILTMYWNK